MKILVSHFGVFKKGGWGRTFSLANALVELGNNVTVLTTSPTISFRIIKKNINGVNVIVFPDFAPSLMTSKGFGVLSLFLRILFVIFHKYEILHSDAGHRPSSGWPCIINRFLFKGRYIAEWWDYFGKGGQLDNKPAYFKFLLGAFENWSEIHDKKTADGIVVLSNYMKERALKSGINKEIRVIHGGADVKNISRLNFIVNKSRFGIDNKKLVFGYIGMSDSEISDLEPFIRALNKFKNQVAFVTFGEKLSSNSIIGHQLNGIIKEMGWIDYSKDANLLSIVDVFVLIKKNTVINIAGWPNKLGDYMACGRPILINPYGDVAEFVTNNKGCFITTSWNESEIEQKIQEILDGKYPLEEMSHKARYIAENKISWLNKGYELSEFYIHLSNKLKKNESSREFYKSITSIY